MKTTAYVKDLITGNFSKQHYSHINDFAHDEDIILPEDWQERIIHTQPPQTTRQSSQSDTNTQNSNDFSDENIPNNNSTEDSPSLSQSSQTNK